jgi:hypothetical protein
MQINKDDFEKFFKALLDFFSKELNQDTYTYVLNSYWLHLKEVPAENLAIALKKTFRDKPVPFNFPSAQDLMDRSGWTKDASWQAAKKIDSVLPDPWKIQQLSLAARLIKEGKIDTKVIKKYLFEKKDLSELLSDNDEIKSSVF